MFKQIKNNIDLITIVLITFTAIGIMLNTHRDDLAVLQCQQQHSLEVCEHEILGD